MPGDRLSGIEQSTYYSEWYYSAIHLLVDIAKFRTIESIAGRLSLPVTTVKQAVEFLISSRLLDEENGTLLASRTRIHLDGDSPLITRHHANWRLHTLQNLHKSATENHLHYSSVVTISEKDSEILRELLIETIKDAKEIIRESKEEDAFSINFDFYRL
jgi:hypothetical protein